LEPKYDIFRDPIHGFIKVYGVEKDIINSKPFQRLRRIRQLGLTSLVYHGAEHTRFGHSIGVMDFASKMVPSVAQSEYSCTICGDLQRTPSSEPPGVGGKSNLTA
jgi:HD superfamily phosphohydrolase